MDPEYVLDRMATLEMEALLESIYLKHRDSWEQTRQVVYTIAQVNSRKRLEAKEIMPFAWDKPEDTSISDEERERLNQLTNEYIRQKQYGC